MIRMENSNKEEKEKREENVLSSDIPYMYRLCIWFYPYACVCVCVCVFTYWTQRKYFSHILKFEIEEKNKKKKLQSQREFFFIKMCVYKFL